MLQVQIVDKHLSQRPIQRLKYDDKRLSKRQEVYIPVIVVKRPAEETVDVVEIEKWMSHIVGGRAPAYEYFNKGTSLSSESCYRERKVS